MEQFETDQSENIQNTPAKEPVQESVQAVEPAENATSDSTQNSMQYDLPKKKKRRIGCFVVLGIFLAIVGVILWFIGSIFFFKPKNLGIKYTESDYSKAVEKTGLTVKVNGQSGSLKDVITQSTKDSVVKFDDYKRVTLTLTSPELSALVNSAVPSLNNVQVKAIKNDVLESSSSVSFDVIRDMLGDRIDELPIQVPKSGSVNVYTKLKLSVEDDRLTASAVVLEIGAVPMPEEIVKEFVIEDVNLGLGDMKIHGFSTDENGNFIIDSTYPHSVNIVSKEN